MLQKYACEFIGTFALVFLGCGAIGIFADESILFIALSFGVTVASIIYSMGKISGAHINPAVTLALYVNNSFEKKEVIPYWLCQFGGSILASLMLLHIFGDVTTSFMTMPDGHWLNSFIFEIALTFILMMTILLAIRKYQHSQAILASIIGFAVFIDVIIGAKTSGASMNPARSFGPSIVLSNFDFQWIYLIAPFIGALIAVIVYKRYTDNSGVGCK